MKKMKRTARIFLTALLLIALLASSVAYAASYPLIYLASDSYNMTYAEGTVAKFTFTIFPEYKNETLHFNVYDANHKSVAYLDQDFYNASSMMREFTVTVNTAGYSGTYTVEYYMSFYSFMEWHDAPRKYTTTMTVVKGCTGGAHTWDKGYVYNEPTCTETGKAKFTCTKCGVTQFDEIAALGHAWNNGEITLEPTQTTDGKMLYTCTRCDATKEVTIYCTGGGSCASSKFTDAPSISNWAHRGIDFAVEHGLFGGTSATTFEPESPMTRAMLVTVLWRYEGQPTGYENTFSDVNAKDGSWYIDAVAWAASDGIVGGIGKNRFDPEGKITREQMATILYRYADKRGIDTDAYDDLSAFPDADKVESWAKDAMQWAVAENLIGGSDGMLLPQGNATRAQVATILMRFIQNVVNAG